MSDGLSKAGGMDPLAREVAIVKIMNRVVAALKDAGGYASLDHVFSQLPDIDRDDVRIGVNRLMGAFRWAGPTEVITASGKFLFL